MLLVDLTNQMSVICSSIPLVIHVHIVVVDIDDAEKLLLLENYHELSNTKRWRVMNEQ